MRLEVPVAPDAPEAHEWAVDELARRMYDDSPGLLSRIRDWLGDLLDRLSGAGAAVPVELLPLLVVGIVLVAVVVALVVAGPVRRRLRPANEPEVGALFEDDRDSRDLRASADAAARAGNWSRAVLERFRAIVRSLDERAFIEDRPGLTAREAAGLGRAALPALGDELRWGAALFDGVRYGDDDAGQTDDDRLRALDDAVRRSRRPDGGQPRDHRAAELRPSLDGVLT
ncbi:MAG: DUF4129 domain-containing protein [Actinomycetaceae bacterium]